MQKKFKAKKSLGQNFLKSKTALDKIVAAGEIVSGELILEIGPGKGALTEKLLETGGEVLAVEKDRGLFAFLQEKFSKEISKGKLKLIEGDILKFEFETYNLEPRTYKLISNIPYNITGAILKKFLTAENQPERMILMVQHEVATRILARDKKESILSVSVKAYGVPKLEMKVPARYFSPAPKVDSAIISIKDISRGFFAENTSPQPSPCEGEGGFEKRFWEIVHAGFAHKRKKLSGNLKKTLKPEKIFPENLKNKRAEDLSLADWVLLTKNL